MTVTVKFGCNGCFAEAWGVERIAQEFRSLNGLGYGFGSYHIGSVLDVVPPGWVAFDSIGATYCPKCADELWPDRAKDAAALEARDDR